MVKAREEELILVYGGVEDFPDNGSSGGGDRIHIGDWVTWNRHSKLGKGLVLMIVFGYALVEFKCNNLHPFNVFVPVTELSLVR